MDVYVISSVCISKNNSFAGVIPSSTIEIPNKTVFLIDNLIKYALVFTCVVIESHVKQLKTSKSTFGVSIGGRGGSCPSLVGAEREKKTDQDVNQTKHKQLGITITPYYEWHL